MPEVSVNIEVWCSCGEGLCHQVTEKESKYGIGIEVEPCEKCLDLKYRDGYNDNEGDESCHG